MKRATDAHIQGLYDPNAPFNRIEGHHPMCEDCEADACEKPCEKVERAIKESYDAESRMERGLYMSYLIELSEQDLDFLLRHGDYSAALDWVALANLGLTVM